MRPDQLNAMFDLVGLDKESFLEALHQLKSDLYSEKWWVRDNLDQFTSAIVAYLVYCYVPGLPEDIRTGSLPFQKKRSSASILLFTSKRHTKEFDT